MFRKLLQDIINFILPRRCLKCGKILNSNSDHFCQYCIDELNFILEPYCRKCGHPLFEGETNGKMLCPNCMKRKYNWFRYSRSAMLYDEASKNLILSFKFMDKTENAKPLAEMMYLAGRDIFTAKVDVIIPIPLHYRRMLQRRYNQSILLAQELSKKSKVSFDSLSLVRHKNTRPQVEFSGHQRIKNVKDAFSVRHPENIKGKRVLLIDDVLTTGSTLKEATIALKKAGAKSVDTLTVARVC